MSNITELKMLKLLRFKNRMRGHGKGNVWVSQGYFHITATEVLESGRIVCTVTRVLTSDPSVPLGEKQKFLFSVIQEHCEYCEIVAV